MHSLITFQLFSNTCIFGQKVFVLFLLKLKVERKYISSPSLNNNLA
uniref:Uncharacterized protein n=1 Tax=Rhizophora mucronata TaxID=61149 RepID=A0A2P2QW31_RHIMU